MRFPVTGFGRRLMVKRIPFYQNLFAGKSEKIIGKRTKHFRNDFRWLWFYVDDENSASNCKVSFVTDGTHRHGRQPLENWIGSNSVMELIHRLCLSPKVVSVATL